MAADQRESEKKAQALLKFALGNHNARRYGEAAGFYQVILKRHPGTEAAQFAKTNLEAIWLKNPALEESSPDETLISRIEQSAESEALSHSASPTSTTPVSKSEDAATVEVAQAQPVVIVDIRMKFWSMVWFMVKWAFATIPALIIIAFIVWLSFGIIIGISRS